MSSQSEFQLATFPHRPPTVGFKGSIGQKIQFAQLGGLGAGLGSKPILVEDYTLISFLFVYTYMTWSFVWLTLSDDALELTGDPVSLSLPIPPPYRRGVPAEENTRRPQGHLGSTGKTTTLTNLFIYQARESSLVNKQVAPYPHSPLQPTPPLTFPLPPSRPPAVSPSYIPPSPLVAFSLPPWLFPPSRPTTQSLPPWPRLPGSGAPPWCRPDTSWRLSGSSTRPPGSSSPRRSGAG